MLEVKPVPHNAMHGSSDGWGILLALYHYTGTKERAYLEEERVLLSGVKHYRTFIIDTEYTAFSHGKRIPDKPV